MERLGNIWLWYRQTSMLLGLPILFILIVITSQKLFFTASCELIGFRCEYALGATDAMTQYMGQLIASNPNADIVSVPRKK